MTLPAEKAASLLVELESRRHRRVATTLIERADVANDDSGEIAAAADMIGILATALEQIAETTSDETSRTIALIAMAEFHGR
jgi:hypothetical protein